jgi:NADH-quinone oxidoreductase subunit G
MVKLIIDDIPVEVPTGTNVLEAARSVGITIPHFCYHPALKVAGACRLCAVKVLEGGGKGIQMSCSLPVQEGMVVSTTDPEALKLRSLVIEWLMINHPHDCPVCDEGGECLLQDFTIAGGHGRRRYQGKKRTFLNQYLGEGIQHEMNRCIECYRCVRFYQDYAGGTDFGVTGNASRVYFGRFTDGALASPFSGNLLDICPTGVFTDKHARFRARYWDYQFAPSICPHCSVGCNTSPQSFHREVIKIVARRNDQVNGWFICDRGRFNIGGDPLRPREPMIDGAVCGYEEALDLLSARISDFIEMNGPDSLALVGSTRLSLEGAILLGELARHLTGSTLCYFADPSLSQGSLAAARILTGQNAATLNDLEVADCIVLINLDLMEEGAILALAVRKAWLSGARICLVAQKGEPSTSLPFDYTQLSSLSEVGLKGTGKEVIICGAGEKEPELLSQLASLQAKLILLQPGPNGFGAALLALDWHAVPLLDALASKKVKGIVCFEADLPKPWPAEVTILGRADWRACSTDMEGSTFLPTTTWMESTGTSINFEGRAQRFQRSAPSALPLKGLPAKYYGSALDTKESAPLHPPRVPSAGIPGSKGRDCWKVIASLIEKLGGERLVEPLSGRWAALGDLDPEGEGVRVLAPK